MAGIFKRSALGVDDYVGPTTQTLICPKGQVFSEGKCVDNIEQPPSPPAVKADTITTTTVAPPPAVAPVPSSAGTGVPWTWIALGVLALGGAWWAMSDKGKRVRRNGSSSALRELQHIARRHSGAVKTRRVKHTDGSQSVVVSLVFDRPFEVWSSSSTTQAKAASALLTKIEKEPFARWMRANGDRVRMPMTKLRSAGRGAPWSQADADYYWRKAEAAHARGDDDEADKMIGEAQEIENLLGVRSYGGKRR